MRPRRYEDTEIEKLRSCLCASVAFAVTGAAFGVCEDGARRSLYCHASLPLLTVITWNMHGGRGDLRRLIADLEAGRLTPGAPRDYVLLLQEFVNREDVPGSATRALTLFTSPVRSATGNAILSTIPLEASRTIDLPRERQPRAAVAATIRIGGDALFVVSTHLENRLGWLRGLFGDRARGRQADALLQALPQGHGIVGGDFNTMLGPNEPAWRALLIDFLIHRANTSRRFAIGSCSIICFSICRMDGG